MQPLFEKLQADVTAFCAKRDARWLLMSCADADAPIVFKVLLDCERKSRGDLFLLFGAPFRDPEQYVDAAISQFLHEYQALGSELAARQLAPLPDVPDSLLDVRLTPAQRLSALIAAAERLLPEGGRLLCALWPLNVADSVAYDRLIDALLLLEPGSPADLGMLPRWPQRVRLCGREFLPNSPRPEGLVLRTTCDFGPAALARSLHETSVDRRQPEAVRMHALLMLAQLDQTHGRMDAAIGKYSQVLAYYKAQQSGAMQTVVLLQLGETYHRQQRLDQARVCYEQALTPAAAHAPPCVAQLAKNLGDVAVLEQRYGDAALCYHTWHRIAARLGDESSAAAAQANIGLAEQRQSAQPATELGRNQFHEARK